jgi:hypothetical protein
MRRDASVRPAPSAAALRGRLDALVAGLRARGILSEDLDAEAARLERAARSELHSGALESCGASLAALQARLASLRVDRAFVKRKLERVDARLRALPAARGDRAALKARGARALQQFLEGQHDAANRTLNDILGRL